MYKITIKRKANRITVKKSKPTIKIYGSAKRGLTGPTGPSSRVYDVIIPEDYPTLSAALAEISDNKTIFIKPGTYTETGGTFTQSGISINGGGKDATELVLGADLRLEGNNLSVTGIHFDTNSGNKLSLLGTNNIFEDSKVSNGTVAQFFETGDRAGVSNSVIEATSSSGTIIFNQLNRVVGNSFKVAHKVGGSLGVGFYTSFTGNMVTALANAPAGGHLLYTFGERYVISSNTFFCLAGQAITLDFRGTVSGNSIFQGGGQGIITASDGVTINGNAIMIMTAVGAGVGSAIFINGFAYSTVVTGNNISSDGVHNANPPVAQANQIGIETGGGAKDSVITGNSIAACGVGIKVSTGSVNTLIAGNSVTYYNTGIEDDGTGTVIRDNIGVENDPYVKSVSAGTNITVDNSDPSNPIVSTGEVTPDNITGLITAGDNISITGSGTLANPYDISSLGGGGGTAGWEELGTYTVTTPNTDYKIDIDISQKNWLNVIVFIPSTSSGQAAYIQFNNDDGNGSSSTSYASGRSSNGGSLNTVNGYKAWALADSQDYHQYINLTFTNLNGIPHTGTGTQLAVNAGMSQVVSLLSLYWADTTKITSIRSYAANNFSTSTYYPVGTTMKVFGRD